MSLAHQRRARSAGIHRKHSGKALPIVEDAFRPLGTIAATTRGRHDTGHECASLDGVSAAGWRGHG
jgi:hypothetical protein